MGGFAVWRRRRNQLLVGVERQQRPGLDCGSATPPNDLRDQPSDFQRKARAILNTCGVTGQQGFPSSKPTWPTRPPRLPAKMLMIGGELTKKNAGQTTHPT